MRKQMSFLQFCALVFGTLLCGFFHGGVTNASAQQTTVASYDCWGNLSFLQGPVNISSYSNNGTAVTFPADPTQGHAGGGGPNVVHLDGSSYCSVWGGNIAGSHLPAAGDSVGGSFWIYLLSKPPGSSVDVQMTGRSGTTGAIYCHSSIADLTPLPLNTWVQVPLTPTSLVWSATTANLGFNIVSNGGNAVNCYINGVNFGKQTTMETPAYNCWSNLSFLPGPVNISSYSSNGTAVTFPADPTTGHTGGGGPNVLHFDGTAYATIWGGAQTGNYVPFAGDSIGGSFWIYLLSKPTASSSVDVQMTGRSGTTSTIYCHTSTVDLTTLPVNLWVRLPLAPANVTWVANSSIGFSIFTYAGVNCYVDGVAFAKQPATVAAYDCWNNLNFLAGPVNISSYSGNGTAVTFPADPTQGHAGGGGPNVLHLDGSSYCSVWGGNLAGTHLPAAGDLIGGSFWIYLLSKPAGSNVDVQMTGRSGTTSTIYCHTSIADTTALPLNTWVQVSLAPTNSTWVANSTLGFNIVTNGGNAVNCYIDGVTFGKAGGVTGSTAGALPVFQDYVGGQLNGNFELGSAALGNIYWGASNGTMLNLILNPAGTAPGSAQNGNNMASIACGGFAWDVSTLASGSTDRLARVGDMVGGYYWLYVPINADLSQGFPTVSFVSSDATNHDTTIADSKGYPSSKLKLGAWNQIPVYPLASPNNVVRTDAAYVGFILAAPQLNPSNPPYASPYYIDNIKIGKISPVIGFSQSTGLTDSAGNSIAQLGLNDASLFASMQILNSKNSAATNGVAVLNLYQQGVLKYTVTEPAALSASGSTGQSITQIGISAPLNGIDKTKLSATVSLYDSNFQTQLAAPFGVIQQVQTIAANDFHVLHVGRWTASGTSSISDYVRPCIKTSFTGPSMAIHMQNSANLDVYVDGVETQYGAVAGLFQLASNLTPKASHTLAVYGLTFPDLMKYDALYVDAAGSIGSAVVNPNEIEFIGDSITAWNNGYSWLVPQTLGVESSRICWPGIALQTGFGYVATNPPNIGMQDAYFDIGMPTFGSGTPGLWNFGTSAYTPSIIVINLGTNDAAQITGVPSFVTNFQNAYVSFIQKIRLYLPNVQIFVMRPVSIPYANVNAAIANAAQTVMAGDSKVHYIDSTSWTVQISSDGIHPTALGHTQITNYLVPILTPYLH